MDLEKESTNMKFTLHHDGTISVFSFNGRTTKNSKVIFYSELAESGKRRRAIENHFKRHGWRQETDRHSIFWAHPSMQNR